VLPGAARAAANIVADEARRRSISEEVTNAIKVATKRQDAHVIAKVQVIGPGAYKGRWLEYGTAPHFITVDKAASGGRTAGRVNRLDRSASADGRAGPGGSLVIGGQFVGTTVFHPGARRYPFLRVSLDTKQAEAIAAAQAYINTRVARMRKTGIADGEGPDQ
jgi:hypothetical protein